LVNLAFSEDVEDPPGADEDTITTGTLSGSDTIPTDDGDIIDTSALDDNLTFQEALDVADAAGGTLLSVDDLSNVADLIGEDPIWVNAVFNEVSGVFEDPLTGEEVNFDSFPEFDPSGAVEGDALVYDPATNKLSIQNPESDCCGAPVIIDAPVAVDDSLVNDDLTLQEALDAADASGGTLVSLEDLANPDILDAVTGDIWVDAVYSEADGVFINPSTGEEVNLDSFPPFDTAGLEDGDALVYNPDDNTLSFDDPTTDGHGALVILDDPVAIDSSQVDDTLTLQEALDAADASGGTLVSVEDLANPDILDAVSGDIWLNAVFDEESGVFVDPVTGEEVNFDSFPDFDPSEAVADGQGVVYDPVTNTLSIVDPEIASGGALVILDDPVAVDNTQVDDILTFEEALAAADASGGGTLVSVEELGTLQNLDALIGDVDAGIWVDAVFDGEVFVNPSTGEEVNFDSFPEFDPSGAVEGQALVYDPATNMLSFENPDSDCCGALITHDAPAPDVEIAIDTGDVDSILTLQEALDVAAASGGGTLVSLEELANLDNLDALIGDVDGIWVNAVFDGEVFVDPVTGEEINLDSFPEFDPSEAVEGQGLVYNPETNTLSIKNADSECCGALITYDGPVPPGPEDIATAIDDSQVDDILTFQDALDAADSSGGTLVSVEDLANPDIVDGLTSDIWVNAVYNAEDGVFVNPLTGEEVNLDSFPTFDPSGAEDGDALVYNPLTNTLSFEDSDSECCGALVVLDDPVAVDTSNVADMLTLQEALDEALASGGTLVSVEELANLDNLKDLIGDADVDGIWVNAVFDEVNGVFVDPLTGEEVNLDSFPDFDPSDAEEGQGLVYDPDSNTLSIEDPGSECCGALVILDDPVAVDNTQVDNILTFEEALAAADASGGGTLVSVEELGTLQNLDGYIGDVDVGIWVDAVWDGEVFVNPSTGEEVNFDSFPEFDPSGAELGDALVYDPETNTLSIEDPDSDCCGALITYADPAPGPADIVVAIDTSEVDESLTFQEALDEAFESGGTLVSVEELANLDNLEDLIGDADGIWVNAVFDGEVFVDPLTGEEVNLDSFPDFDPSGAELGEALVYDPETNTLSIEDPDSDCCGALITLDSPVAVDSSQVDDILTFQEALDMAHSSGGGTLVSVEELGTLQNLDGYIGDVDDGIWVNAVFDGDVFVNPSTGEEVNFDSFPDFDPEHAKEGQGLVYDPETKTLSIEDLDSKCCGALITYDDPPNDGPVDTLLTFQEALDVALDAGGTLMSVEELRGLADLGGFVSPYSGNANAFWVNAIFIDGAFRDPLTGEEVNFKSYPWFDTSDAKEGDALVYLPETNTFIFSFPNCKCYGALVSYEKLGVGNCQFLTN
jgi:hypothetical protein